MAMASLLAGLGFNNTRTTLVHAMSHAVTGHTQVPHGIANAILVRYVMEFNLIGNPEKHADIAAALGEEFRALCAAFEALASRAVDDAPCAAQPERARSVRRAAGALPPRPLRFAEYLYYAGRISWADLAEAIAWQRHAGRRIGQWFVERGLIGPGEVRCVREALARHNSAGRRGIPTM